MLSGPHKDGSTHIGVRVLPDAATQLRAANHNLVNKMYDRSVDREAVASVRVGDVLDVRFDGDRSWWAWRDEVRLGRLTWTLSNFEAKDWRDANPRIDDGTLQVIRLVIDAGGSVVNVGGIVRRRGVSIPPVKDAVPDAVVTVPTLRARVDSDGTVHIASEAARVGRPQRSFWRLRFGR
ncbi:hypothetical protein ACFY9N_03760 [Microbacterium sp. NPDC008134]|uniref:hypothetical protein n=1 Tax=Microbacterium sp. NPDC008134 TaxID=3364183 RepID=UPI0036E71F35